MLFRSRGPVHKIARIAHSLELRNVDEMIMLVGDLARALGARRDADRNLEAAVFVEEVARDGRLARAGRRRPDEHQSAAGDLDGRASRRVHRLLKILDLFANLVGEEFQFKNGSKTEQTTFELQ